MSNTQSPNYNTTSNSKTAKSGLDIFFKYMFFAIVVFLCIYLVYKLYTSIKINGENRQQRMTRHYFDNLHGDQYDEEAKNVILHGEAIERPRAIDHYRLGTTYLLAANNPELAHRHFREALNQIIGGEVELKEAPLIIDRIEDLNAMLVDLIGENELPIQMALLAQFDANTERIHRKKEKHKIDKNDPDFAQKTLLNNQYWSSDSQNVHDSAIIKEFSDQIGVLISENQKIPQITTKTYNEACCWLKNRYRNQPERAEKIKKVLDIIDNNYPVDKNGLHERDVLLAVWQRSYDPDNAANAYKIRDSIAESLLDCVEGNNVVCITGRTSKILQSLATLDKNPDIGVLKNKQIIRNTIYQKCAKIVNDYLNNINKELRDAYNSGVDSDEVRELRKCIIKEIDQLSAEYENLLSKDQLSMLISECKEVI